MTPPPRDVARLAGLPVLRWQSDALLTRLALAGHEPAFEAIVQRYRAPLRRYCARLLPSARVDDALQQTFINAHRALAGGTGAPRDLRAWLYRIAHNASLNALRDNGMRHSQLDPERASPELVEDAVERRERLATALAAIDRLPERQRTAVLLSVLEGHSYEDVAAALGVSTGAVRQLLHRSRGALRAAASALTPPWVLERLLAAGGSGRVVDALRTAELTAGAGAVGGASLAKAGAALLAAGAMAGVVLELEEPRRADDEPPRAMAEAPGPVGDGGRLALASDGGLTSPAGAHGATSAGPGHGRDGRHGGSGEGPSPSSGEGAPGRSGPSGEDGRGGDDDGEGDDDVGRERGDDDRPETGTDDEDDDGEGDDDRSGSGGSGGGSGSSGWGGGTSGSGGDEDRSGSSGSGDRSGSSGSGGSGPSGSGGDSGSSDGDSSGSSAASLDDD